MAIKISIKHPLSVINKRTIKEAFSYILNYYDPNKKDYDKPTAVLDACCSEMLMWTKEDKKRFYVTTNDISPDVKANLHVNCADLWMNLKNNSYNIIIYDPPYIDLKGRKDSEKYEKAFNYSSMSTIEDLEKLTKESALCFDKLLKKDGVIIAKITNFHYKNELRGTYDYVKWFDPYFKLHDEIIYRFFKNIPNLNFYSKKAAITHSYFLIFKRH